MKRIESFFEKTDTVLSYTAWTLRIIVLILFFVWVMLVWKPYVAMGRAERLATVEGSTTALSWNAQACRGRAFIFKQIAD